MATMASKICLIASSHFLTPSLKDCFHSPASKSLISVTNVGDCTDLNEVIVVSAVILTTRQILRLAAALLGNIMIG